MAQLAMILNKSANSPDNRRLKLKKHFVSALKGGLKQVLADKSD